jgi:hypothetical protein
MALPLPSKSVPRLHSIQAGLNSWRPERPWRLYVPFLGEFSSQGGSAGDLSTRRGAVTLTQTRERLDLSISRLFASCSSICLPLSCFCLSVKQFFVSLPMLSQLGKAFFQLAFPHHCPVYFSRPSSNSGHVIMSYCGCLLCLAVWPALFICFHSPLPSAFHIVHIPDRNFGAFFATPSMMGVEWLGTVHGQRWPGAVTWRRDTTRWYLLCALTSSAGIVRN